jgi:protein SCO1/2
MKAFLQRYNAKANWSFLTGSREDIRAVQRAFDTSTGDKMSHTPLTFFFSPSEGAWVRIGGFIGAAELVSEFEGASSGSKVSRHAPRTAKPTSEAALTTPP